MRRLYTLCLFLLLIHYSSETNAQQSVAIGTTTPDPSAVLLLVGNGSQGLIIPVTSNVGGMPTGSSKAGMIVYNSSDKKVYYYDGTNWGPISGGVSGTDSQTLTINGNAISISNGNSQNISAIPPTSVGQVLVWDGSKWTSSSATVPTTNQVLMWNGTTWAPATLSSGGTVTNVTGTAPVTVVTGTTTPAISIAPGGITNSLLATNSVNSSALADGSIAAADLSSMGAISSGQVLQWNGTTWAPATLTSGGDMTKVVYDGNNDNIVDAAALLTTTLPLTGGGTGATTAAAARTNLGLGALSTLSTVTSAEITNGTITAVDLSSMGAIGSGQVLQWNGTAWAPASLAAASGDMTKAVYDTNNDNIVDAAASLTTTLPLASGGTGATTAAAARTNLGLGTLATLSSITSAEITDGTITGADLAGNIVLTTTGGITAATFTGDGSALTNVPSTVADGSITGGTAGAGVKIASNTITDANIASSAAISGTKITPAFGTQNISTTGTLSSGATTVTGLTIGTSVWPANASGVLTNNGTGTLTWTVPLTNPMTTTGDIIYGGAGGLATSLAGAAGFLKSTGASAPAWSAINLASSDVSGVLPLANGGTGASTQAAALTNLGGMGNSLNSGNIFVGNGSNIATGVAMSGDATISNAGAVTLTNSAATRTNLGLGSLSILNAVTNNEITDASITGADIALSTIGADRMTPGTNGQVLTTSGGVATWAAGFTNPMTTAGDLIYRDGTGPQRLAAGTGFLKGGGTPTYAAINLASADVSGTLPITAGGTGATTASTALSALGGFANPMTTAGDIIYRDGAGPQRLAAGIGFLKGGATPAYAAVNLGSTDVSGTLPVANGGTGAAALSGVVIGTGSTPMTSVFATAGNQYLRRNPTNTAYEFVGLSVTSSDILDGTIIAADINGGSITSGLITDGTITNVDVASAAAIDGTKINPTFGTQNISTTGTLSSGAITATNLASVNSVAYTWPNAQGAVNTVLTNNGSGTLTWAIPQTGWSLTGNSGTNPATNFIGTTDLQDLVLKTNNAERIRILAGGQVAIGDTPLSSTGLKLSQVVGGNPSNLGISATVSGGTSGNTGVYGIASGTGSSGNFGGDFEATGGGTTLGARATASGGSISNFGIEAGASGAAPSNIGVYAHATGGSANWAGYFDQGNVHITNGLSVGATPGTFGAAGEVLTSQGPGAAPIWSSGGSGWSLTGNAGTNPATNFIGTTDAQPLLFKTGVGGIERMRIDATGKIGIGTSTPTSLLELIAGDGTSGYPVLSVHANNTSAGTTPSIEFSTSIYNGSTSRTDAEWQIGLRTESSGTSAPGDRWFVGRSGVSSQDLVVSRDGNIGIGVLSPVSKLDVNGDIHLTAMTAPTPTTDKLYNVGGSLFWNGTNISSGSSGWGLTGNSGTNIATNFIGTTDNVGLRFKTNNNNSGLIDPVTSNAFFGYMAGNATTGNQNVGIGTNALIATATGAGNVGIGTSALQTNTTGGNNIAIGSFADVSSSSLTNAIAIGANTSVGSSNSMVLGGTGANAVKVGIDTSLPLTDIQIGNTSHLFDVTGATGLSYNMYESSGSLFHTTANGASTLFLESSKASLFVNSNAAANATFGSSLANRMILTSTGLSINKDGPNNSAVLHVVSQTVAGGGTPRGFMMPSLITSDRDAIPSPLDGLMIYNETDHEFNYYNGLASAWQKIGDGFTAGNGLTLTGSTLDLGGTISVANTVFQGSADNMFNIQSSASAQNTKAGLHFKMFQSTVGTQYEIYARKSDATANSGQSDLLITKEFSTAGGNIELMKIDNASNNIVFNGAKTTASSYGDVVISNGNVGIGISPPIAKLDVNGDINTSGEINRAASGASNMVPIAYGFVASGGGLVSGTSNLSANNLSSGTYEVGVSGETINTTNYVALVTPSNGGGTPVTVAVQANSGVFNVYIRDVTGGGSGTLTNFNFYIVIYKY